MVDLPTCTVSMRLAGLTEEQDAEIDRILKAFRLDA